MTENDLAEDVGEDARGGPAGRHCQRGRRHRPPGGYRAVVGRGGAPPPGQPGGALPPLLGRHGGRRARHRRRGAYRRRERGGISQMRGGLRPRGAREEELRHVGEEDATKLEFVAQVNEVKVQNKILFEDSQLRG